MRGLCKRKGAEQWHISATSNTPTGRRQRQESEELWMQEQKSTGMLPSCGFKTMYTRHVQNSLNYLGKLQSPTT